MPLKVYCPNTDCAEPILYDLRKPVTCPYCSCGLDSNATHISNAAQTKPIKKTSKTNKSHIKPKNTIKNNNHSDDIDKEDDIQLESDIDASSFAVEIEKFGDRGIKFEDLAKQSKTGYTRPPTKKVNKKKEMELFRIEASKPARIDVTDGGTE